MSDLSTVELLLLNSVDMNLRRLTKMACNVQGLGEGLEIEYVQPEQKFN